MIEFEVGSTLDEHHKTTKEIQTLRDKIISDNNLNSRTDDEFLLRFLRARKFDREKAFKMIKNYYNVKKRYPEIFRNFSPSSMMDVLQANILMYIPQPDSQGRNIAIGRASAWDVSKISLCDLVRVAHLLLEELIRDEVVQMNGFYLLLDAQGLTVRHLLQLTPRMIFLIINVFLDSFPVRYKGIHVFNTTKLVDIVITTFWPFLPVKFKQRIMVHQSLESIYSVVDATILPEEYGGNNGPFDNSVGIQRLIDQEEYLREQEKYWS